jgi:processive 1,2-diacylglycerol beta-glucosyltransferase
MNRIAILTSSTGGGHDMRAYAFQNWIKIFRKKYGIKISVHIIPAIEQMHPFYNFGVNLYNWIQCYQPRLHHIYYNFLEVFPTFKSSKTIFGKKKIINILEKINPNIIISVHDHLNHAFFNISKKILGKNVLCITYCGEFFGGYGFSKHWINPNSDFFIGAVSETCSVAKNLKMPKEKIWKGGLMLSPNFSKKFLSKKEKINFIKNELGFKKRKFILVLGTGANGANNHLKIIKILNKYLKKSLKKKLQIVLIFGNNNKALEDFKKWTKKNKLEFDTCALKYRRDMNKILQIASAIFIRPGTGTTSEALLMNCPIIFNGIGGIMPQELITIKFAKKYGFGKIIKKFYDLIPILNLYLKNKLIVLKEKSKMKKTEIIFDPIKILKFILKLRN